MVCPPVNHSGWEPSHEVNMWFAHVPHRFVVTYNPGADGRSAYDSATGGITLDPDVLLEHAKPALRYVATYGGAPLAQPLEPDPLNDALQSCVGQGGTHTACSRELHRTGALPCRLCTHRLSRPK